LQSSLTLSNFRDAGVGFELRNQIRHCKTVCIKSTLYLINYNRIRTQWTTKGNRDAGSSCSWGRGLHRYLRNFGGGGWTPQIPPRYATGKEQLNSVPIYISAGHTTGKCCYKIRRYETLLWHATIGRTKEASCPVLGKAQQFKTLAIFNPLPANVENMVSSE